MFFKLVVSVSIMFISLHAKAHDVVDFYPFLVAPAEAINITDKIGGIIFFKNDFKEKNIMCNTKEKMPNALTMTDQENGNIYRINDMRFPNFSEYQNEDYDSKTQQTAKKLKQNCLDIDLAPMVESDIKGERNFSDADNAILQAQSFAVLLRQEKIIPTWKHFPGITQTSESINKTNIYAPYYSFLNAEGDESFQKKENIEIFAQYFKTTSYDMLMISSNVYPSLENTPAVLSQKIISLAHKMQPNSLIISDDASELNLNQDTILKLFRNTDFILVTSEKNMHYIISELNIDYQKHLITQKEIINKLNRIHDWKQENQLSNYE